MIRSKFNSNLLKVNSNLLKVNSNQLKLFSSSDEFTKYIRSKHNTIINICNQNEKIIIERFGKFLSVQNPGLFLAIPLIDKIKYVFDTRELTIPLSPQHSITQDNVSLELGGCIYVKFVDIKKAAYNISNPIYAVVQFSQAAMRAVVGKHNLDEIFNNRDKLNQYIVDTLRSSTESWGMEINRYEITEVNVPKEIKQAMSLQASAERERRQDILKAEALKKSNILESEGIKQKLINQSEGEKTNIENKALAHANATKLAAEAEKFRILMDAEGRAKALEIIGEKLSTEKGQKAAQIELALKYIKEYGNIIGNSNTILIPNTGDDVSSFVAKSLTIGKSLLDNEKNNKI